MKSVNCDVIQDLLPSYVDKISSESTNKLVEEHIKSCEKCQEALQSMSKDIDKKIIEDQDEQLDYLKGFRKDKVKSVIFAITLTVCICLGIFILLFLLNSTFYDKNFYVSTNDINVEYMYMDKVYNKDNLTVYLYSDKYDKIQGTEYKLIENDIHLVVTAQHVLNFGFNSYSARNSGELYTFILDDNIEKVYIEDQHGESREIWNKNTKVMSKEEWKQWYFNRYVPDEVKKLYSHDASGRLIIDTGVWRNKYSPKSILQ